MNISEISLFGSCVNSVQFLTGGWSSGQPSSKERRVNLISLRLLLRKLNVKLDGILFRCEQEGDLPVWFLSEFGPVFDWRVVLRPAEIEGAQDVCAEGDRL